jgi:hypothetical protein
MNSSLALALETFGTASSLASLDQGTRPGEAVTHADLVSFDGNAQRRSDAVTDSRGTVTVRSSRSASPSQMRVKHHMSGNGEHRI